MVSAFSNYSCWVFKGQCDINSVSGIIGFLGFVYVKTGIFIGTLFL